MQFMKKYRLLTTIQGAVFPDVIMKRLLITLTLLFAASMVFAQSPIAVVRETIGTVELKKPGAADWTAASPGEQIDRATVVSTGFRSTAVLTVGNSTLMVRPLTSLNLEDFLSQNETEMININLRTGRIRVEVTPPAGLKSSFTVRSPASVASVRGTSFEMDTTSIYVLEGTVSYAPVDALSARPVNVGAGNESWVDPDTGGAVNPMVAAEVNRSLPDLPGQNAGTLPDDARATPELPSSLVIDVTFN